MLKFFELKETKTQVKIEIKNEKECYYIYVKDGLFSSWKFLEKTKEKDDAQNFSLNLDEGKYGKINFIGVYKDGVRVADDVHSYNIEDIPRKPASPSVKKTPDICNLT